MQAHQTEQHNPRFARTRSDGDAWSDDDGGVELKMLKPSSRARKGSARGHASSDDEAIEYTMAPTGRHLLAKLPHSISDRLNRLDERNKALKTLLHKHAMHDTDDGLLGISRASHVLRCITCILLTHPMHPAYTPSSPQTPPTRIDPTDLKHPIHKAAMRRSRYLKSVS